MQPDVSVIVPVYNVEPYLEECVESLFQQTLENIEYIFIDDASTDNSVKILRKVISRYPEKAERIRLILHDKNKGIAFTRQEGINKATGKYIIHCDSDDIVDHDIYNRLLAEAIKEDADIVVCSYELFGENTHKRIISQGKEQTISSFQMLERLCGAGSGKLHGSLCNKLIRKEICDRTEIPQGVSYCEDETSLITLVANNKNLKIKIIPDSLYKYRLRNNSLTLNKNPRREKEIKILIEILENLKARNPENFHRCINSKIIELLYAALLSGASSKNICSQYSYYKNKLDHNNSLNYFRKLQLKATLNHFHLLSKLIGFSNQEAIKLIKRIRNFSHKK